MKLNTDSYGEITNGLNTYIIIGKELLEGKSVIIGWTDEEYDHRDILFTFRPQKHGTLQRGLNFPSHLYVSIIDYSSMGFLIEDDCNNRKANGYIKEKLRLCDNHCDDMICDLINGVILILDMERSRRIYE